ncbi:hypothetical protein DIPPA_31517 [Diplonema papillatum]|nr:hypothetical protein DIPPA_31517 [Diplonema papillatum]
MAPSILCLSLPRTGTLSMAEALAELGYKSYHSVKYIDDKRHWDLVYSLGKKRFEGKHVSREEWDELFGEFDAITDTAGCFSLELLEAYPEAKVILVERPYDKWAVSFRFISDQVFGPMSHITIDCIEWMIGTKAGDGCRYVLLNVTGAKTLKELRANIQKTYETHDKKVEALVPPERLLKLKLGDDWAPLCKFLGKEVPDTKYPHSHEAAAVKAYVGKKVRENLGKIARRLAPWLVLAVAVGVYLTRGKTLKQLKQ